MSFALPRLPRLSARFLMAALSLGLSLGTAHAATVTYSTTLPLIAAPNLIASGTLGATAILDQNVTGTILNARRSPWDAANSLIDPLLPTSVYSAIRSTSAARASAFYDFIGVRTAFSFVWGTPGPLNRVELFLNGVSQLVLSGATPQAASGALSVFTQVSDVSFDRLVFSAGKPALEYANLRVSAVPLPAGGLLLLGALAGVAALRRRKAI